MVKRQRAKSTRGFYIALGAVAIVGAGIIAWSATRPKPGPTLADTTGVTAAQAEGYLYGNPNAPVQILEFADFECPACGQFAAITEPDVRTRILDRGLANLRYFDFPLAQHKNTMAASNAAACAAEQGKFWPMHDKLFAGQLDWNGEATDRPDKVFAGYAKEIGLDLDRWTRCVEAQTYRSRILGNRAEAIRRKVQQTPTFVIGNKQYPGALTYDQFKAAVDSAAAQAASATPTRTETQARTGKTP